jgi:hypothetical protein
MKLSLYQVISTYLVLQASALPPKGKYLQPSDFEHYDLDPITINPDFAPAVATFVEESTPATLTTTVEYELTTETSSPTLDSSSPSTPAESSPPGPVNGGLPFYGNMTPGKPIWQCWHDGKFARNSYHLTAVNWNMTESRVKSACKKSDAMTAWQWDEHRDSSANAQMFTAKVRFPFQDLFSSPLPGVILSNPPVLCKNWLTLADSV